MRREIHVEASLGWEVLRFQYTSFGLSGASGEEYIQRPEPLAWALAALMRWPGGDRHAQRRACLDRLTRERHLDGARRFLLFNCISTYLELDGRALEQYQTLLAEHSNEEEQDMAMTWAEKFEAAAVERGMQQGMQQGMLEGKQQGMQELLLRQLQQRFAPLPASVTRRVSALASTEELTRLAEKVLSARSLEELGLA